MSLLIALTTAAALSLAQPATPQTAPTEDEKDPTACEFSGAWEPLPDRKPTYMFVTQNQSDFDDEDSVAVGFFNEDWSISEGDKVGVIKITGADGKWLSNEGDGIKNGFIIWTSHKNLSAVVPWNRGFTLSRANKVIASLASDAINSGWMSFETCRAKKVTVRDEKKRQQELLKANPKDPFAK